MGENASTQPPADGSGTAQGAPARPPKSTFRRWGVPFLVVGVLFAGLNAGCQALINSGDGSGGRDGAALVACKQAVKAQLNYPATADFQTFSTTIEEDSIRGVVEAKNAFGVPAEIMYVCERSGGTVTSARLLNG